MTCKKPCLFSTIRETVCSSTAGPPFSVSGETKEHPTLATHATLTHPLLDMFSTREATSLRLVCKFVKDKTTEFNWKDQETVVPIKGLDKWKRCFPNATALNISVAIKGNFKGTWPVRIFKGLERIEVLNVQGTNFKDSSFKFFPNVKHLYAGETFFIKTLIRLPQLLKLVIKGSFYTPITSLELRSLRSLKVLDEGGGLSVQVGLGVHAEEPEPKHKFRYFYHAGWHKKDFPDFSYEFPVRL